MNVPNSFSLKKKYVYKNDTQVQIKQNMHWANIFLSEHSNLDKIRPYVFWDALHHLPYRILQILSGMCVASKYL